jgi:hypothetical protein
MVQETDDPDALYVLVLERVDRTKNMARYYVLSVEPTLFVESALVRRWGRIGAAGAPGSTFIPPSPSRRSRSTNGSSASGAAVTDSASDRRRSSFCRVSEESYGAPATAPHS